ncbi:electron transfer flavoprotein subunit beta/FixA family protein [Candidatus Woesearchaeota archaeon]|nr:electron transfer flavoprotein subunit beta/FixA family protein [Candidatus Woesearchaeota archaeon]
MNIIVCIKQVPDTNEVKIDQRTGTLVREGVPSIMNPDDKHALIEAVKIRDKHKGKLTALSMGPPQAEEVLREALALGADEAILLCDRAFAGSDTWATANAIGGAIKSIGNYDLLLFGRQAIDGDTAQVGPQVAEFLKVPQITYAQNITLEKDKVKAERQMEEGYEVIESKLPCLITCISDINEMKYPSLKGIRDAYRNKDVKVLSADAAKVNKSKIGLLNSPTSVKKSFTPSPKGGGQLLKGSAKEVACKVVSILKEKELVGAF